MLQLLPCKEKVVHVLKEHDRVERIHFLFGLFKLHAMEKLIHS